MFGGGGDGVAADDFAEADDGVGEVSFADVDIGPEGMGEFLFADEVFGAAHQAEESVEGFGLEGDGSAGFFQEAIGWVEFEVGEAIGGLGGALIFL